MADDDIAGDSSGKIPVEFPSPHTPAPSDPPDQDGALSTPDEPGADQVSPNEAVSAYAGAESTLAASGEPPYSATPPVGSAGVGAEVRRGVSRATLAIAIVISIVVSALVGGGTAYLVAKDKKTVTTEIRRETQFADTADLKSVIAKVKGGVVAIVTSSGAGTGFVIDKAGLVVTNAHVVGASKDVSVTFSDGTRVAGDVRGIDRDRDVAVISVKPDEVGSELVVLSLGDSAKMEVGDQVIAIGNGLALEGGLSVTEGIVSALDRTLSGEDGTLANLIQTDASISAGNSGGPLINASAQVIGINTAVINPQVAENMGFSIAIDSVKPTLEALANGEDTKLAYLGVQGITVDAALAKEQGLDVTSGAYIVGVEADSPAKEAGLEEGDVVTEFSGKKVTGIADLVNEVRKRQPGDKVTIKVNRHGREESFEASLSESS